MTGASYREITIYKPRLKMFELLGGVVGDDWLVMFDRVDGPTTKPPRYGREEKEGILSLIIGLPIGTDVSAPNGEEERIICEIDAADFDPSSRDLNEQWLKGAGGVTVKISGAEGPLAEVVPFNSR